MAVFQTAARVTKWLLRRPEPAGGRFIPTPEIRRILWIRLNDVVMSLPAQRELLAFDARIGALAKEPRRRE